MAITMLDPVEFNKIPALNFVLPTVTVDPTGLTSADEGRVIYNTTTNEMKYCNEALLWIALGASGAGGPPSGAVPGGDLTGSYPSPTIGANKVTEAKIAALTITDASISASANIAQSKINGLTTSFANKVDTTTTITAGNGLVGGGTLAANRTLDVGAGTGITVAADAISVDTATIATRAYADSAVSTHAGAADPHTGYLLKTSVGVANGAASLDSGGKVPTAQLPPLAINDVFVVASQAAMLALTAEVGDMAIRTDTNQTFVLSASPASTLANWKEVLAAGQVVSVNGSTGVVTITAASISAVPTSRQVIAGNGLTGTGALSGDVTLNFVGDANMTVAADAVSIISAPKWTTPRSITLTGDVTGTVASVDGSANVSIATTAVGSGTAAKHYAGNVGAGTAVVVNHALNTRDVNVEVYRATTPWDTVQCTVERTDLNNVTLKFAVAVGASAYRCVVTGR
jgi:hypothetical protein